MEKIIDGVVRRVARAAERSGRRAGDVRILPVTKTITVATLTALWELGWREMGENRVQEIRTKEAQLGPQEIDWVLIGHLQRNKARQAANLVGEVQSVDSLRIAGALDRSLDRPMPVLLEVNTSGEPQKGGFSPDELRENIFEIAQLENLTVNGLMTVASRGQTEARQCFVKLRELRDELAAEDLPLNELSMGMSDDFEIAIEEGATCVRLGRALFGERQPH